MGTGNHPNFPPSTYGIESDVQLWRRPGEVQLFVSGDYPDMWCKAHPDKALARAMMAWDHRITADQYCRTPEWVLGEDRFDVLRHRDGTQCGEPTFYDHPTQGRITVWQSDCTPRPRCPKCREFEALTTKQEAWRDVTTCATEGCDYEASYSIGD